MTAPIPAMSAKDTTALKRQQQRARDIDDQPYEWAFSDAPEARAVAAGDPAGERRLDRSWFELLREHMPFRDVPDDERAHLVDDLRQLELVFLDRAGSAVLDAYYSESYVAPGDAEAKPADARLREMHLRHVVMMQAKLFEQTFQSLRLDRYANAPANAGWVNLFRRWGSSPTFNRWLQPIRELLIAASIRFYDDYIANTRDDIGTVPVPHPWDPPDERRQGEGRITRVVPGIYLDSGIFELRDDRIDESDATHRHEEQSIDSSDALPEPPNA